LTHHVAFTFLRHLFLQSVVYLLILRHVFPFLPTRAGAPQLPRLNWSKSSSAQDVLPTTMVKPNGIGCCLLDSNHPSICRLQRPVLFRTEYRQHKQEYVVSQLALPWNPLTLIFLDSSIYQSNGLCHDFCLSSYAFAVVQGDGCWCSNYAPGTTTTGCSDQCPGYPPELCGGSGVYGYIALALSPSGTKGAPSSSAAASKTATPVSSTSEPPQVWLFFLLLSTCILGPSYTAVVSVAVEGNRFDLQ
jgi:hypothetical protein